MNDWSDYLKWKGDEKTQCPSCGRDVTTTMEEERFDYGAHENAVELKAQVPVHHCTDCDLDFTDGFAEIVRHAAVCAHLGVMTPQEITSVREAYGLSIAEFAKITRIEKESLARWENANRIPDGAHDQFLYLLTYPENLDRLRKRTKANE